MCFHKDVAVSIGRPGSLHATSVCDFLYFMCDIMGNSYEVDEFLANETFVFKKLKTRSKTATTCSRLGVLVVNCIEVPKFWL